MEYLKMIEHPEEYTKSHLALDQRKAWTKAYLEGEPCDSLWLADYRKNHESDTWRASSQMEKLCAYVLFLEQTITEMDNIISEYQ